MIDLQPPVELHHLSDAALLQQVRVCRSDYARFTGCVFRSAVERRRQIGLIMLALEEELYRRGLAETDAKYHA